MPLFNITYRGRFRDEGQLPASLLAGGGVPIDEGVFDEDGAFSTRKMTLRGLAVILPLALLMVAYLARCLYALLLELPLANGPVAGESPLFFVAVLALFAVSMPVHELIHALCCPRSAEKGIYFWPERGALFVYFTEAVGLGRFVWISVAPALVLAVVPLVAFALCWRGVGYFVALAVGTFAFGSFLSAIGDFYNVYVALNRVAPGALVFNDGLRTYATVAARRSPRSGRMLAAALSLVVSGAALAVPLPPVGFPLLVASLAVSSFAEGRACVALKWATFALIVALAVVGHLAAAPVA